MNEPNASSPQLSPKQLEKQITSEIIERLAVMLVADSPMRSAVQQNADKLRGRILAALPDQQTRDAFLDSRNILTELARLLTRCQDRDQLAKTLNYIKSLNKGDVMITADDPREEAMRGRLNAHLLAQFPKAFVDFVPAWHLTDIINIVRFVDFDPIH